MSTELLENPIHTGTQPILGQSPHQVRVVRSCAEFSQMRTEWDGFIQRCGLQNLAMSHGWLNLWLSHFPPKKLFIVIVQDANGEWLGVAPLQIKPSRNGLTHRLLQAVEWIGTNPTVFDWMQFMIHPVADERTIVNTIADALQQEQWDLLELKFCLNHQQLEWLVAALPGDNSNSMTETNAIPYVELPATVEAYEANRRKKTRLEVNRHTNRFIREFDAPPTLTFVSSSEATDATLTRFFAGHIKYWAERGQKSDFQRFPDLFEFYKDMLAYSDTQAGPDDPKLLLSVMTIQDYQLSYHLGFWQGDSYLSHLTSYNQGFKGYSPGTIHMDRLIFETLERGGSLFEFGRGDEPYKTMWTKIKKPLFQIRIFRNPISAALWQVDILLKKLLKKGSE